LDNDRGAVTAEFMLLMPAAILAVTLLLGSFTLALERVKFEFEAFQFARSFLYGLPTGSHDFLERSKGNLSCVEVRSNSPFSFRSEYCLHKIGT
jgi:hypothetical protein